MNPTTIQPVSWAVLIGLSLLFVVILTLLLIFHQGLRRLREGADRLARGDLRQRLHIQSPLPIGEVASALNRMADQLEERLNSLAQQRNELDAVLASMVEGVLAVDQDDRLLSINPAGARVLGIDPRWALGRSFQEFIRHRALQRFFETALQSDSPIQANVTIPPSPAFPAAVPQAAVTEPPAPAAPPLPDRVLQAQGAALRDAMGRRIGALVVLHDITRLQQLENIQRQFVANVSHELRTPIAAIKAALETILDGDPSSPQDQQHFLQIASRQANRLEAIIEDLLSLSRLEQDLEAGRIELHFASLHAVLSSAAETCLVRAQNKKIQILLTCPTDFQASANPQLLEQAVVNLLDNAIKYSPDSSTVQLSAQRFSGEMVIAVSDEGPGIDAEHLPRLFDRFYRTDKARSRAVGGTGLGLAIVKHIAQAHSGHVSVDSTPGQGSTFRIHLPAPSPSASL
ncbi:MAG: HAMP domain-containing protein [Phycisphaeraceae bacterium]|nr:HAMP domain-containing protein [Phycisphaeraceae bacterium]